MSARRGLDDYRTVLDPGRLRRRLLTRAAVAAGAIVLMLAGLMFFGGEDGGDGEAPERAAAPAVAATSALPARSAMPLAKPLPETPPEAAAAPARREEVVATDQPAVASDPVASAVSPAGPEPESSSTRANAPDAPAPLAAMQTEAPDDPPRAPSATRNPADSSSAASEGVTLGTPAVAAPAGAVTPAGGFSAHLGEYGALDKAGRLRKSLFEQGLPATLVRRVVIGPVSTRRAAEQVVARLRQDEQVAGFIVSAGGGKGFLVQTGVFADPGNAEAQQRRLSTSARKATIEGRVVLGPYVSREEADAVLAKVRRERKIAGTIVAAAR